MNQNERSGFLIQALTQERREYKGITIPSNGRDRKGLLRGLMNMRMADNCSQEFFRVQDAYLREEISLKGITELKDLTPIKDNIYLWQGDITTLRCDAIVNAANSGMTGCYIPNHKCIDNCIHSFAGIQLRMECAEIMRKQGYPEPTGKAKITRAYNLPCKYILHTVGPIINRKVKEEDCKLLAQCYQSCLELAEQQGLRSVAFCCISTGEFHFPNDMAAEIAVETVTDYMKKNTSIKEVIFNVYKDMDEEIYRRLLQ